MKLINYKMGYNNTFDCSIHGTIKMSLKEYKKAIKYLKNNSVKWGYKYLLVEDLKRVIKLKNGFLVNIRVSATDKLVKKFDLSNYKVGNYQILVV